MKINDKTAAKLRRLHANWSNYHDGKPPPAHIEPKLLNEACRASIIPLLDELEAVRAERYQLREALERLLTTCGAHVEDAVSRDDCPEHFASIDAARAALGATP